MIMPNLRRTARLGIYETEARAARIRAAARHSGLKFSDWARQTLWDATLRAEREQARRARESHAE